MANIKAIETSYKGYRFRSRLEARWAVFFDALGVTWEYEKEGFHFDGKRYLSDFWLPDLSLWVEIKGELADGELELLRSFREEQTWPVACIVGSPGNETIHFFAHDATDSSGGTYDEDDAHWVTINGGLFLDVHPGRGDRTIFTNNWEPLPQFTATFGGHAGSGSSILLNAYDAARSARFEHGQSGGYRS